jgi:hypothetical protein
VSRIVVTVPAQIEGPLSQAGLSCSDSLGGGRFYLFCHYDPFAAASRRVSVEHQIYDPGRKGSLPRQSEFLCSWGNVVQVLPFTDKQ